MNHIPSQIVNTFRTFDVAHSTWADCLSWELTREMLPELKVHSSNVLFGVLKIKTVGEFFALDVATVFGAKRSGVKTCADINALRTKIFEAGPDAWRVRAIDTHDAIAELPESISRDDRISESVLCRLPRKVHNILLRICPCPTIGDLCDLTPQRIREQKGAGKQITAELMALRQKCVRGEELSMTEGKQPSASDFGSLSEMILKLDGTGKAQVSEALGSYMGLLNCTCRQTLEACGKTLDVTRERVRQIAASAVKRVFDFGGVSYFISDDWECRNKSQFDAWAMHIAEKAGIPFEPYDVPGMKRQAKDPDDFE